MKKHIKIIIIISIIILLLILIKVSNIYDIILRNFYPKNYCVYVEKYSNQYNIDSLIIYSIMKAESNFEEKAKSSSGAKGLMQLMDSTANEIATNIDIEISEENEILDPEKNINIGVKYYSDLLNKYNGNMLLALAAYNAGIGNVDSWISKKILKPDGSNIENIPFKETNMYVRKIVNNYKMYKKLYEK